MSAKTKFIDDYRQAAADLIRDLERLQSLKRAFIFQNFISTMTDADFQFSGTLTPTAQYDDSDLVKQDMLDASTAVDAIEALLTANTNLHYSRLYKVRRS